MPGKRIVKPRADVLVAEARVNEVDEVTPLLGATQIRYNVRSDVIGAWSIR